MTELWPVRTSGEVVGRSALGSLEHRTEVAAGENDQCVVGELRVQVPEDQMGKVRTQPPEQLAGTLGPPLGAALIEVGVHDLELGVRLTEAQVGEGGDPWCGGAWQSASGSATQS